MKPGKTSPGAAEWRCPQPEPELAGRIAEESGILPVTAQVLVNRGVRDADAAGRFLNPSLSHLEDPARMAGTPEAAGRIREAVGKNERILVFGDYDADGVTSSALLYELLKFAGADCEVYLPSRTREGYGLTPEAASEILRRRPDLVVTVDCGTGSPDEVAALGASGVEVVVTDHHPPGGALPEALAVVNPKRADCQYPFKGLAGVGVAFKLAWEVARRFSLSKKVSPELRRFLRDSVGLVALGTVADVAPLVGENRILVHYGLGVLAESRHPGLRGLIEVSGLTGKALTADHIAYRLGPRLNAAGRTGSAESALALLLEDDLERGHQAALELDRANRERQRLEGSILRDVESHPALAEPGRASIVLGSSDWHPGVVGIAASRLAERTGRPTVLVAFDGEDGRGSARSVLGVDVAKALGDCAGHLEGCGGHAAAAGVRVRQSMLDGFREDFDRAVRAQLGRRPPAPVLELDGELGPEDLTLPLAEDMDVLEPFGHGNPRPVFAARGVELGGDLRPLGADGKHFAFHVTAGARRLRAVAFNFSHRRRELAELAWKGVDVAFELRQSDWSGPEGFELCVKDIRAARRQRQPDGKSRAPTRPT